MSDPRSHLEQRDPNGRVWRPGYPPVTLGSEADLLQQIELAEAEVERLKVQKAGLQ